MTNRSLEDVLADARERAAILRSEGHGLQARSIEQLCDEVKSARDMRMYLDWLDEPDAALYAGREAVTLRRHFAALESRDMARWHNGRRQYRRQALDHRGNAEQARAAGERAAVNV